MDLKGPAVPSLLESVSYPERRAHRVYGVFSGESLVHWVYDRPTAARRWADNQWKPHEVRYLGTTHKLREGNPHVKRKRPMPPALKAYWAKRRGKKAKPGRGRARKRTARPRGKVTVITSRTVRRTNPRMSVLYAVKGRDRLKYLGGIKFGKRGRAKLFRTAAQARAAGAFLRGCFAQALKGFRFEVASG